MTKATAEASPKTVIEEQTEKIRQIVIAARKDPSVGPAADQCFNKLNDLYKHDPEQFSAENVRWVNVLRGTLAVRLAAHHPAGKYAKKAKRKGDQLDHCWRCETPIDERFTEMCPTCKVKEYQWRVCPVCAACGCQRAKKTLV
jgi:hypothetical protein